MAVRIRLARSGAKKRPFYRIVAADSRSPRDGKYLEKLGTYDPHLPSEHAQRLTLDEERIRYWLGQGAGVSDRVHRFLHKAGLMQTAPHLKATGKKATELAEKRAKEAA